MENLSRVFQKQKRKKNMKRMCFITQFKIEFLLLLTSCRKVLGKMPGKLVCLLVSGPRLVLEQLNSLFKKIISAWWIYIWILQFQWSRSFWARFRTWVLDKKLHLVNHWSFIEISTHISSKWEQEVSFLLKKNNSFLE